MNRTAAPHPTGDAIVIYPGPFKMRAILFASIGLVLGGIWLAVSDSAREQASWRVLISTWLGVPFFVLSAIYAAVRLVKKRPMAVFDHTGIRDSASAIGVGHLHWSEVDHLWLYDYRGQLMLGIVPKSVEAFVARQPVTRRALVKFNLELGCAPANIPQAGIEEDLVEVAAQVRDRFGVALVDELEAEPEDDH